jgi:asparagine synthase (glutamine-hydrolysing)
MWAFAIYDVQKQGLLLARDRFGEKPLFTDAMGGRGRLRLRSQAAGSIPWRGAGVWIPRPPRGFLATGRPYDGFSSWFKGIDQLPPASWTWIERDGTQRRGHIGICPEAVGAVEPEVTPEAWADRFGAELRRSVMLRLRSDVPVGTSLSAGVDSSAIAAEVQPSSAIRPTTGYTVAADGATVDEAQPAERFAHAMGARWTRVQVEGAGFGSQWDRHHAAPGDPGPVDELVRPVEGWPRRRGRDGVIVLLDGQGADEVLADTTSSSPRTR